MGLAERSSRYNRGLPDALKVESWGLHRVLDHAKDGEAEDLSSTDKDRVGKGRGPLSHSSESDLGMYGQQSSDVGGQHTINLARRYAFTLVHHKNVSVSFAEAEVSSQLGSTRVYRNVYATSMDESRRSADSGGSLPGGLRSVDSPIPRSDSRVLHQGLNWAMGVP
ncbi:hypothetical protein BHM03_00043622 [Ensete ventricosum]|nr:hypothetical protein BHM03_00043622 [Ensete ventricosum]